MFCVFKIKNVTLDGSCDGRSNDIENQEIVRSQMAKQDARDL